MNQETLGDKVADESQIWARWERCWMGFRPSPFYAVHFYYWAEEFVQGNRHDLQNPLRWDKIKLNLPGDPNFDPTFPEVMKWDSAFDRVAGDVVAFVDDLRISGYSEEHAWAISRQVASRLQYLGIQDAPRKRRVDGGAWAGAIMSTDKDLITKTISQEKWDKAKGHIRTVLKAYSDEKEPTLEYKFLEQVRGFLCHLSMTYDQITPLLKGLHLTLAAHVPGRDEEGWKLSDNAWTAFVHQKLAAGLFSAQDAEAALHPPEYNPKNVPVHVKGVERLKQDFAALNEVFEPSSPPLVSVRALTLYHIMYGFGDASGKGFGSTMLSKKGTRFRIGTWDADTEEESSNYREFENIVETLEAEEKDENMQGALIFVFPDNSTVESAVYKGNSSSQKLFKLVLRLKASPSLFGAPIFCAVSRKT